MKRLAFNPSNASIAHKRRSADIGLILVLALLPFFFFWRLITPNPADQMSIAAGDFTEQYFPLRAFTAQQWVRGEIPLWNPYLYGGQPALADIQSGTLYPIHLLQALILGWGGPLLGQGIGFPLKALEWQAIIHFSIAAMGMYLFGRHVTLQQGFKLRQARFAGVIASLTFTYSGYLTGFPVQQLTILEVSAWLPWILWGLTTAHERMCECVNRRMGELRIASGRMTNQAHSETPLTFHAIRNHSSLLTSHFSLLTPPAAWTALAFAFAILAGHPQTVMYIFYLTLAYTVFNYQLSINNEQSPIANYYLLITIYLKLMLWRIALWLMIVLLGTAIAAAQLLPTLEFIARSVRSDLSYQAVSAGLPLNELISVIYPGFFGGSPQYVGIATLVLIALALTMALSQVKNSSAPLPLRSLAPLLPHISIFFWLGAALISLLLAFGNNLFVYPVFYLLAPGFDAVRQQERVFLIYSFSAAMLAGYGAVFLITPLPHAVRRVYARFEKRLRQVLFAAIGLTAFLIYGATAAAARGDEVNLFFGVLRHHIFGLIFLGGMLILLALRQRRWLRRWWGMGLMAIWVGFNLFTVNWRFNLETPPTPAPFTPNGVVRFLQTNLQPITNYQLPITNYPPGRIASGGLLSGGNSAASVYELQDLTGNTPLQLAAVNDFLQQMPDWRLWQLMNVRYVVDRRNISDDGLRLVFEEGDLKVFEMGDPFERAWFVSNVEVIPDNRQALTRLADDTFDLRRSAVVAKPLPLPLAEASDSTVTVTGFGSAHLSLAANAAGPHLLVLSQIHDPGWRAEIDGRPIELLRVNGVQQGIVIPAGQHRVTLRYWPASFTWGLVISAVGLVVCGLILIWSKIVQ